MPTDDPESTYGCYLRKLIPKIPEFPVENFLQAEISVAGC